MKMTSYSPQRSLYGRLSGFSRQSLAASQVARIVGNCFRNPAQMRSRRGRFRARVCVCVRANIVAETGGSRGTQATKQPSKHGRSVRADPDV